MTTNNSPRQIQSVNVVCQLIAAIRDTGGLTVTELADDLDRSPGTISTYLSTLQSHGVVVKTEVGYDLGPAFIPFGEYVRHNTPLYQTAREEVDRLSEETGECSHLIIEHDGQIYTLYENFGENAVGVRYHSQKREQPLDHIHCTAAGKTILAHLPENRVRKILADHGLTEHTSNTITEMDTLLDQLSIVREQGYALADEEQFHGLRAVGAPIVVGDGTVAGAITLSGPSSRFRGDLFREEFPNQILQAANIAEVKLETQERFNQN